MRKKRLELIQEFSDYDSDSEDLTLTDDITFARYTKKYMINKNIPLSNLNREKIDKDNIYR